MTTESVPSATLKPVDPAAAAALSLAATSVRVEVVGLTANVVIDQRFVNTSGGPLDAVLRVALPEGAALRVLSVRQGARTVNLEARDAATARTALEQARARRAPAPPEELRDEVYALQLNGLGSDAPAELAVEFAARVRFDGGEASFTLPASMVPSHAPAGRDPRDARRVAPPLAAGERLHGVSLELDVRASAAVGDPRSMTHALDVERTDERHVRVRLRDGQSVPDRDLTVTWTVDTAVDRPLVATERDASGTATIAVTIAPPARATEEVILPRDVVFALDRSAGALDGVRRGLRALLRALGPRDTFALVAYDGSARAHPPSGFTDLALDAADDFLDALERGNSPADPAAALALALAQPARPEATRTLVLVCTSTTTTALRDAAIELVARAADGAGLRAYAVGVGPAADRALVRGLARAGRGAAAFAPDPADAEPVLARLNAHAAAPLATAVSVRFDGADLGDAAPRGPSDVDLGRASVVFARGAAAGRATVDLRARVSDADVEESFDTDVPAGPHGSGALAALWARARVADLLAAGAQDAALALALAHGVVSAHTALVAVDRGGPHGAAVVLPVYGPEAASSAKPAVVKPVARAAPPAAIAPANKAPAPGGGGPLLDVSGLGDDGPIESTQTYDSQAYATQIERMLTPRERIEAALRFLARCQSASGAWSDAETTRLVLSAYKSAGEGAQRGTYRRQLARAESWLARGPSLRSAQTLHPLNRLISSQAFGGPNDGAVIGHGDPIAMTAMLVKGLVVTELQGV